eukprot:1137212-Pelagomonas_calceolata.AAC.7
MFDPCRFELLEIIVRMAIGKFIVPKVRVRWRPKLDVHRNIEREQNTALAFVLVYFHDLHSQACLQWQKRTLTASGGIDFIARCEKEACSLSRNESLYFLPDI